MTDESGRSHRASGAELGDYHAFGAPVVAPVAGRVWRCEGTIPDNPPGGSDTRPGRNFGNHVLLRTPDGVFVLLGHLRQHSLAVGAGDWVEAGTPIGACGNSGRSTQPHVHLQAQMLEDPGAPTRPSHLRGVVVRDCAGERGDFRLAARPRQGALVTQAAPQPALAGALHMPAGRTFALRDEDGVDHGFAVELTLLGQFRLTTATGASAAFEERADVLAFYDRRGGKDAALDAWLLALGVCPFAGVASRWRDAPPADLAPLAPFQRLALALLRPFGASLDSRYERTWDEATATWRQTGHHALTLLPGVTLTVDTEAEIDPVAGCVAITLSRGTHRRRYMLADTGRRGDVGVAALVVPLAPPRARAA